MFWPWLNGVRSSQCGVNRDSTRGTYIAIIIHPSKQCHFSGFSDWLTYDYVFTSISFFSVVFVSIRQY